MSGTDLVFLPGEAEQPGTPLGRYLPRLPRGVVSAWLANNLPPSSWLIDPFGSSPQVSLEAAQAGYRVLTISNNPITRFLLEMGATPPTQEEMRAALASLASARRGDERLEPHLRALYATTCANCGAEVEAQAFFWEKDARVPYAKVYTCPACQQSGEFPTDNADMEKAEQFTLQGLHRARALERIAASGDPNRQHAEEALEAYLPRAVYALINLVNKLDGLDLPAYNKKLLHALLLSVCDQANNLWHVPAQRYRPRQLSTPTRFRENNVWRALENAIAEWADTGPATPLTYWPAPPPEGGGICLFEGRVRDLAQQLAGFPIKAVVSALPRPNQAFWTLCALWSGWLWGREAIGPFVQVLRRQRYDWGWHTSALHSSLHRLVSVLAPGTPFFGLVTENEAGFDAAAQVAAALAGFKLQGIALQVRSGQSQCLWRAATAPRPAPDGKPNSLATVAIHRLIMARGEPTAYLQLQSAAILALDDHNAILPPENDPSPVPAAYSQVRQLVGDVLAPEGAFVRFQGGTSSIEIGKWWPKMPDRGEPPLADRVEMALVNLLQGSPPLPFPEIEAQLYPQFPGLLTPEASLLEAILISYADRDAKKRWHLRSSDTAAARRADVTEIKQLLTQIGERLGHSVSGEQPLIWQGALNGKPLYFYLIASAMLGKIVLQASHPPEQGVIVLPGGRSDLALHKLERNPHLAYRVEGGWRFLKFRFVRQLAGSEILTRDNFASHFNLDPLTRADAQLPLL